MDFIACWSNYCGEDPTVLLSADDARRAMVEGEARYKLSKEYIDACERVNRKVLDQAEKGKNFVSVTFNRNDRMIHILIQDLRKRGFTIEHHRGNQSHFLKLMW